MFLAKVQVLCCNCLRFEVASGNLKPQTSNFKPIDTRNNNHPPVCQKSFQVFCAPQHVLRLEFNPKIRTLHANLVFP